MTGPLTPGQITDIVHAAILAAEHLPAWVELKYATGSRDVEQVDVQLWGSTTRRAALAVLARLDGRITVGAFTPFPFDPRYGRMSAFCDRVGVMVRIGAVTSPVSSAQDDVKYGPR